MSGLGRRRREREPVGGRDRPRRAARRPRRRRRALRHLDEGRRHRRPRLDRAHERVHGAARLPRRLRRRRRRARRLDLRDAPLRPRRGRRARRRLRREGAARAPRRRAARRCSSAPASTTSTRPSSAATARRGSSTTSRSTTRGRTDGPGAARVVSLRPQRRSPRSSAPRARASTTSAASARSGGVPHFDDLLLLGASISRYPLEGYRERCGTDVVLGTRFAKKPLELKIPITIAGMSFGALSAPAKEALGRGATEVGTSTTTGDGGMTPEERRELEDARLPAAAVALRHEPGRPAPRRRDRGRRRPGREAGRRRDAARPQDLRPRRRDARPAEGDRPAQRLAPSGLDRARTTSRSRSTSCARSPTGRSRSS